jgi:hypothetical protein
VQIWGCPGWRKARNADQCSSILVCQPTFLSAQNKSVLPLDATPRFTRFSPGGAGSGLPGIAVISGYLRITPRPRRPLQDSRRTASKLAARLGLEPRQNESESFVLPLHHQAVRLFGKVEPAVGVEPTTLGLQNRCSATELSRPRGPEEDWEITPGNMVAPRGLEPRTY